MHNSPTERTIFVCGIGYTRRLELDRLRLDKLVVGGRRRESAGRQPWGKAHLTARVKEAQQSFSEGQAKLRALPLRICLVFPDFRSGTMLAPQQPVHGLQAEFTLPLAARLEGERPVVYSVAQLYLNLCSPMDCRLPSSSVHRIFQARIVEWVGISYSRGSSGPRDRICISCISGMKVRGQLECCELLATAVDV